MTAPTTVFAAFSVLKDHVKFKFNEESVSIDNIVFRLHYRVTFLLLLVSSILVTSRQFIGEHIKCIADAGVPSNVIETYCFFTTTYTVVKHLDAAAVLQGELPHPGVGPAGKDDPVIHHAYYQWVPFVLFFQAILFYIPHYLWRRIEGGRLKMLVSGLHMASLALNDTELKVSDEIKVPSKQERDEKIQQIRIGFLNRLHLNRPWAYGLTFCEVMNFTNVLMQIYLTDWFLGGAFLGLGQSVVEPVLKNETNPLDIVFPKVTKCTFHKYGPSGTIQTHDALCVMALNIVNEKIYTVLWFWFIVLAVVTGLELVWRMLTMILHARLLNLVPAYFSAVRERDVILLRSFCGSVNSHRDFLRFFSLPAFLFPLGYMLDGLGTLVHRALFVSSQSRFILTRTLSYNVVDLMKRDLLFCSYTPVDIDSSHPRPRETSPNDAHPVQSRKTIL